MLVGHQVGRLSIDTHQLLLCAQAILADRCHMLTNLRPQTRNTDHVEFVEVVRADGEESKPFQQRVARVFAFGENPTIERQPREFPIEKPRRRGGKLVVPGELLSCAFGRSDGLGIAHLTDSNIGRTFKL